ALTGAMFFMVAHGLSIAALFFISGWLIDRGKTSSVYEYGGMQQVTPILAGTWLFAGLASIALPGLSGFVPEYLVLMGTYKVSIPLAIFAVLGVLLAAMYILMPYQRIFTGRVNPKLAEVPDLSTRQKWIVAPILAATVVLGIWSAPLVGSLNQISEQAPMQVPSASPAQDVEGSN
ncbi:MAG: proton-conducting transporter membrane subunit, partial [Scrofimicrobium sp.]